MEVNATLLVQAVNFFIAYVMIRKLLLVPVVKIIEEQRVHSSTVQMALAQLAESIDTAKRSRSQLWTKMRDYFAQQSPGISVQDLHVFKGITPEIKSVAINQQEKEDLAKHATKTLTNVILDK